MTFVRDLVRYGAYPTLMLRPSLSFGVCSNPGLR